MVVVARSSLKHLRALQFDIFSYCHSFFDVSWMDMYNLIYLPYRFRLISLRKISYRGQLVLDI